MFTRVSGAVRVKAVSISRALVDGGRGGRLGGRCRVRVCWSASAHGSREMRMMMGRRERWSKCITAVESCERGKESSLE